MNVMKLWYHIIAFIQKIFYKAIYRDHLTLGKNVTWRRGFSLMIGEKGKVIIGDNCFFNNDCSIAANNLVDISEGVLFGENVKIYDHNHRFKEDIPIKEQGFSDGEIRIGKHCWIGSNVVLLKGTQISDNCVVGAGCVVSESIPEKSIVKLSDINTLESIRT